jgi:primase-polymerase (primpol)-like protein
MPIRIHGANASVFDRGNQLTFEEALVRLNRSSDAAGLGFVLDEATGLGGVDLDGWRRGPRPSRRVVG